MPRRGPPPRAGGHGAYAAPAVERPPPPAGYICYRCGQKGHWIQDCPTNDNQDYDNRPRFKRTTGIPKSMLRTVEQPTAEQMSGVMVTPDGSYVIATPDSDSWNRSKSRARPLSKTDVYQSVPSDPTLACPYCSKLLRDAVITPCCQTSFCEECVQTYLFEHDFLCPECEKHIQNIETLKIDDAKRKKVREYIASTIERSEEAFEQGTKVDEEANAAANEAHEAELAMQAGNEPSAPADAPKDEGNAESTPAASSALLDFLSDEPAPAPAAAPAPVAAKPAAAAPAASAPAPTAPKARGGGLFDLDWDENPVQAAPSAPAKTGKGKEDILSLFSAPPPMRQSDSLFATPAAPTADLRASTAAAPRTGGTDIFNTQDIWGTPASADPPKPSANDAFADIWGEFK